MSEIGIDISGVQPRDVPGDWKFIVVKVSEGLGMPNHLFDQQWAAAARTTRGGYHYARPLVSRGSDQGNYFSNMLIQRGFQPGRDIWQLDAEDGENDGVSGTTWRVFIDDFMAAATARLGRRGFLYAGLPFLQSHGLTDLPYKYMWWLPDYGRNDGADHGYSTTLPVVIHQFSSAGSLDQNKIINQLAYNQAPVPNPAPGGNVQPRFNPPTHNLVDALVTPSGAWGLAADGSVYTFAGFFQGAAVGRSWFSGHLAARIVVPGAQVAGANPPFPHYDPAALYEVIATDGSRFVPFNAPA